MNVHAVDDRLECARLLKLKTDETEGDHSMLFHSYVDIKNPPEKNKMNK